MTITLHDPNHGPILSGRYLLSLEGPTWIYLPQRSNEWLEFRRDWFTATDAPKLLGSDPYNADPALAIWKDKCGTAAPFKPSFRMRLGNLLEETVLHLGFEEVLGEGWQSMYQHLAYGPIVCRPMPYKGLYVPFMASLDATCTTYDHEEKPYVTIFEAKTTGEKEYRRYAGVFPYHYDQVQAQLMCSKAIRAYVVYLVGNSALHVHEVKPDESRQAELVKAGYDFLDRHFPAGLEPVPPEPPAERERGLILEADDIIGGILERLVTNRQSIRNLEAEADADADVLKDYILSQDAKGLTYQGKVVDAIFSKGRTTINWEGIARTLGAPDQELIQSYTKQGEPSVSLRERGNRGRS